jgi:hypothetical protein
VEGPGEWKLEQPGGERIAQILNCFDPNFKILIRQFGNRFKFGNRFNPGVIGFRKSGISFLFKV